MIASMHRAVGIVGALSTSLAQRGLSGDAEGTMLHATDYLDLMSTDVIAWQWIELAAVAREALAGAKLAAAQYWPRIDHLATLCRDAEDSYARLDPDWL